MIYVKEFIYLDDLNKFLADQAIHLRFIDLKFYPGKENFPDQKYMLVYEVIY